ncbi:MAG: hypothetical protein HOW97_41750 [Catenulispora sp.]|nr:hypothetical protein [Catenulispora sp.]
MNSWINLDALWKIVVIGLLAGAGLPALFAIGLRALAPRARAAGASGTSGTEAEPQPGPALRGPLIAGLCFATVLAAMGWGIYSIVHNS